MKHYSALSSLFDRRLQPLPTQVRRLAIPTITLDDAAFYVNRGDIIPESNTQVPIDLVWLDDEIKEIVERANNDSSITVFSSYTDWWKVVNQTHSTAHISIHVKYDDEGNLKWRRLEVSLFINNLFLNSVSSLLKGVQEIVSKYEYNLEEGLHPNKYIKVIGQHVRSNNQDVSVTFAKINSDESFVNNDFYRQYNDLEHLFIRTVFYRTQNITLNAKNPLLYSELWNTAKKPAEFDKISFDEPSAIRDLFNWATNNLFMFDTKINLDSRLSPNKIVIDLTQTDDVYLDNITDVLDTIRKNQRYWFDETLGLTRVPAKEYLLSIKHIAFIFKTDAQQKNMLERLQEVGIKPNYYVDPDLNISFFSSSAVTE